MPTTEEKVMQAFYDYAADIRRVLKVVKPEDLIKAIDSMDWSAPERRFLAKWKSAVMEEAKKAGARAALKMPKDEDGKRLMFTLDNPYSEPWAKKHSARLVKEVTKRTKEDLKKITASGFGDHITVEQQARLIRGYTAKDGTQHQGVVGLLSRDAGTVSAYYDRMVTDEGMTPDDALAAASRYSKNLLMRRGENIARTETAKAQEHGKMASWQVARDRGLISRSTKKRWIAAPNERTCEYCSEMHNQLVEIDEDFESSEFGAVESPPLHPSCRCSTAIATIVAGMKGHSTPKEYTDRQLDEMREKRDAYQANQRKDRAAWLANGARKPRSK